MLPTAVKLPPGRVLPTLIGIGLAIVAALAIVILTFPLNLVLAPAIAVGVAMILLPPFAPILLVASVPVQDAGAVSVGDASITLTLVLFGATIAIALLHLLHLRQRLRWTALIIPYLLYLGSLMLSMRNATEVGASLTEIYRWTVPLITLVVILYTIRSRRAVLWLVGLVGAGALIQATLGGVQAVLGLGPPSFAITGTFSRAYGTFGMPNTYGAFLEIAVLLLIPVAVWALGNTYRTFHAYRSVRTRGVVHSRTERHALVINAIIAFWLSVCAFMSIVGVGISFSRGAWLGTAAGLFAMILVTGRRTPLIAGIAAIIVGLVLAAGGDAYAPEPVRDRYQQMIGQLRPFDARGVAPTSDNFAAVERMAHWQTGAAMIGDHPFTGVGAGNYNARFTEYAVHPDFRRSQGHAHNYYIHATAEAGFVGLAAYLTLIGTAATLSLRSARGAPTAFGRSLGIGAVGVTTAVAVHNMVENLHVLNLGVLIVAVWALAVIGLRYLPAESGTSERTRTDVAVPA